MARKTKQQKQEDALINKLISQRMSLACAQVNVMKLGVIAKAAEDAMVGTRRRSPAGPTPRRANCRRCRDCRSAGELSMRYEVWHRDEPTFRENNPRLLQLDFPKGFKQVAVVEVDEVGRVFEVTNHISHPWTENAEVVELPAGPRQRSTSVGDVIVEQDTLRAWTVDSIGLTQFEG